MYSNILHLTDLTREHYSICEKAVAVAKKFNAKLYLLHVIELPPSLQLAQGLGFAEFDRPTQLKDDALVVMRTLGEALNISVDHQYVEIGSIKTNVLQLIQTLNCELMIVGSHVAHYLPKILDSTAQDAAQKAPCDVLTIRC
jgi:nucleotide-binding universal stress UspA family protein